MGNGRGMPKPAASCTQTVMPGMVVKTQLTSPVADKAQQGVMELLLINHPLDCPVCDKGGECPLQNQAMSNGRAESRFHDVKRTFAKPIAISSNVLLDRERCVLCQRCTRFSNEIAGDPFIDLLERGAQQQIGTSEDTPFHSYFSGNTVQICPVGALTGASYRFRARPFDLHEHRLDLRTLRVRLLDAGRLAAGQDHPSAGRRRRRRQRRMELRQGPLGVPLRHPDRPAADAADPQRGRPARPGQLDRGVRAGRERPARSGRPRRGRRAARRPAHRRRRLRLRQVRPAGPRRPTTSTSGPVRPATRSSRSSGRTSPE